MATTVAPADDSIRSAEFIIWTSRPKITKLLPCTLSLLSVIKYFYVLSIQYQKHYLVVFFFDFLVTLASRILISSRIIAAVSKSKIATASSICRFFSLSTPLGFFWNKSISTLSSVSTVSSCSVRIWSVIDLISLAIVFGVIPCSLLYASCLLRRRVVSPIALSSAGVISSA